MWIFTDSGFLSIVQDTAMPGHLLVRARVRRDLKDFILTYCTLYDEELPILETPDRDYRYRVSVRAPRVGEILEMLITSIDYSNFKNRVHDVDPDPRRSIAYTQVWTAMMQFQEDLHPEPVKPTKNVKVWYGKKEVKRRKRNRR